MPSIVRRPRSATVLASERAANIQTSTAPSRLCWRLLCNVRLAARARRAWRHAAVLLVVAPTWVGGISSQPAMARSRAGAPNQPERPRRGPLNTPFFWASVVGGVPSQRVNRACPAPGCGAVFCTRLESRNFKRFCHRHRAAGFAGRQVRDPASIHSMQSPFQPYIPPSNSLNSLQPYMQAVCAAQGQPPSANSAPTPVRPTQTVLAVVTSAALPGTGRSSPSPARSLARSPPSACLLACLLAATRAR